MNDPLSVTVQLPKLTPAHLAAIFWAMDDAEQGKFFDELGTLVMSTPTPFTREIGSMFGLDMQMHAASRKATALGQDAMRRFRDNGTDYLLPKPDEVNRRIGKRIHLGNATLAVCAILADVKEKNDMIDAGETHGAEWAKREDDLGEAQQVLENITEELSRLDYLL